MILRISLSLGLVFNLFLALSPTYAATEIYKIDPKHSSVSFKIRHIVSKVQGNFNSFSGTIHYDPSNPIKSKTNAIIEVASIDTGVENRDNHLRGEDFFHVSKFPEMKFTTTKITKLKNDGKNAELVGKLTMHGITKPVVMDVVMNGKSGDHVGFTGTTTINRKDFGISWNKEKDGNLILGDQVEIILEVEGIKN